MEIRTVFFDLDGTLTDSKPGITRSVAYALKHIGIEEDPGTLGKFVGPPLLDSFRTFYGFNEAQCAFCLKKFREYFSQTGIYENAVFDGAEEMLKRLREQGLSLVIATSKPEYFALKVVSYFDIAKYFDCVVGGNLDGTRTEKDEVIRYILETRKIDPREAVMIGDRKFDVLGAKAVGMRSIGALWGYGDKEELLDAGADVLAPRVGDVPDVVSQMS